MSLRSLFQPDGWAQLKAREPQVLWEIGLVLGGVVLIGLTLHLYPAFDIGVHPPSSRSYLSSSEADRQIEAAQSYLTSHPDDFNTYVALAMAHYEKGPEHFVDAMNALDKARDLGATSEYLFFYAGVMYEGLGLPDYAINEFSKYLRHFPNDYETMIRLANLHFRLRHFEDAQKLYKEALRLWPKDPTAWFNYAILNRDKGDYAAALGALERVVGLAGHLPPGGLYEQGEIYRLQGDSTKALLYYHQELAGQPDYIPALEATEVIARSKGDLKQARGIHQRVLQLKREQQAQMKAQAQAREKEQIPVTETPPVPLVVPSPTPAPVPARVPHVRLPASQIENPAVAAPAASSGSLSSPAPAVAIPTPATPPVPIPVPAPVEVSTNTHG